MAVTGPTLLTELETLATQGQQDKVKELRFLDPLTNRIRVDLESRELLEYLVYQLAQLLEHRKRVQENANSDEAVELREEFYFKFQEVDMKFNLEKVIDYLEFYSTAEHQNKDLHDKIHQLLDELQQNQTK